MKIKLFKGSFYDIGLLQGQIYKANGMNFDGLKINKDLYRKQLSVYEKYYPQIIEELEGVANGGGFDKNKLIYSFIAGELIFYRDLFRLDRACTIFGYKSEDKLYIGRNYDWVPEAEKFIEVYKVENPERNTFIAVSDMGVFDVSDENQKNRFYYTDDAINDKGLFVGITFAAADEWNYGISCSHMTKLIVETCENMNDVIEIFNKVPICCPKNFFVADKNGDMAVIEHTSKKFKVRYPDNDILIQTNHYVNLELADQDTILKRFPSNNTFIRYYETLQQINLHLKNFELESIKKVLCRKSSYTCQNHPDMRTIWTLGLEMTDHDYRIYFGILDEIKSNALNV
jgi:predicted choloylglycine hydrolase